MTTDTKIQYPPKYFKNHTFAQVPVYSGRGRFPKEIECKLSPSMLKQWIAWSKQDYGVRIISFNTMKQNSK